ncbi:uncharacterized protein [Drosophila bipectinata]|uniref:uncharacterized protein n=1 Tax=Drosophila bipectinata TaxID=42026 RepID=UPI001C892FAE|nr:uncharacterized protein LOC108120314 [Drosophila bipectinata]
MSNISALKKIHRVLVCLSDTKRLNYVEENHLNGEIKVLDNNTMLVRMPNASIKMESIADSPRYYRQLEFDAIGYDFEPQLRLELNGFMGQMFRQRCHGSLLRLTPQKAHNPNLLTRLLVTEVDKLMVELRCRIRGVNVDYFDVRKFDMVNLLVDPASVANRQRLMQSGKSMQSTRELFQWLVNDFSTIRARGMGDDYLDFEFIFRDSQQNQHKIHLAIFQIYGSELRPDVAEFFKTIHLGRQGKSTLLNDCLKESFDAKCPIPAVVMFELPMALELGDTRRKILKLADSAYNSLTKYQKPTVPLLKPEPKPTSHSSTSLGQIKSGSGSRNSVKSVPDVSLFHWRRTAKFSEEDYNGLAYWYGRIDSKFTELKLAMEQHFKTLYKKKLSDICSELRSIQEDMTSGRQDDQCGGDGERTQRDSDDGEPSRETYEELLKTFQKLAGDAAKTGYASTLKVYVSTKNYELSEAEKKLKQQEIENLRLSLIQFITAQDSKNSEE